MSAAKLEKKIWNLEQRLRDEFRGELRRVLTQCASKIQELETEVLLLLGTSVVPFFPFYFGVSLLKLNILKKGTVFLGNLGSRARSPRKPRKRFPSTSLKADVCTPNNRRILRSTSHI